MLRIENFDLAYPKILNFITKFSNIIYTLLKNILTTVAIPITLLFILSVEIPRVTLGVMLFDNNQEHAIRGATVVVLTLLVLEFLIHYIKEQANRNKDEHEKYDDKEYVFSLRIFFSNLLYTLGYNSNGYIEDEEGNKTRIPFKRKEKSPAASYEFVAGLTRIGIILISLIGTMQPAIQEASLQNKAWHIAIQDVVLNSNLQTFTSWIVSVFFTLIIVNTGTTLSRYVSIVASNVTLQMEKNVKQIIQDMAKANILNFEQFVDKTNSRKLRSLTNLNNDDTFETDGNKVRFIDSVTGKTSKWFNVSDQNEKNRFLKYMELINDTRISVS